MKPEPRYEIILYWSNEDEAFIAEVPELAGCAADGATRQEALANAKERLRLAEQRYAVGVGSAIELGDAQVALALAAAQAVQADDKLSTARAQLLRALGRQ